ncbi:MAG TPA: hypothetical protein V6C95_23305 [Coleofasciculaceae cyanobacterium]
MAKPIGFYTSYNPQTRTPGILDRIQHEWGSQLEHMAYEQKIVMRAALAGYIAERPVWKESGSGITLIDACIESAGVDWNIWDEDAFLVEVIQHCSLLDEGDIEGLIAALTSQIQGKIYASRTEEWVVVTP